MLNRFFQHGHIKDVIYFKQYEQATTFDLSKKEVTKGHSHLMTKI